LWQESIDSNKASAKSAHQLLSQTKPGATAFEELHAMDYLAYAYLQTARDAEAKQIVDGVAQVKVIDNPIFSAAYGLAAVPARYALERRDWKSAAALVTPPIFPWEKFPYAEANIHFARAVGGARSGDLETARTALARLTAIQTSLQGQKGFDWATQVEIQRLAAAGWLARAEKKDDEALALLRKAADLEDSTDKHPVTPGAILPAREQLADLYAELGRPREALAEYTQSLKTAPARYVTLLGAAKAADAVADAAKAKSYYGKLAELTAGSSSERARAAQSGGKVAAR
jgi:tetratricopeptide (TPR) repeat protein